MIRRRAGSVRPDVIAPLAILLVHGGYAAAAGVRRGGDTPTYSAWADALLRHDFDYPAFIEQSHSVFPPTLYSGFVTVVALLKLAFGARWGAGLVALNVMSAAAAGALVVRAVVRTTGSRAGAWAALGLYLASFDLVSWTPYLLSDPTFVLLAFAPVAVLGHGLLGPERRAAWLPPVVVALLVACLFYRPTGILVGPAAVAGIALWVVEPRARDWLDRRVWPWRAAVASAVALGGVALLAHAWWMQDPARWPLRAASRIMRFNAAHYRMGEVVWDRPETFHAPPSSYADFAAISLDRLAHYFYFVYESFSFRHNAVGAVFFVPAYLLSAYAVHACLWRRGEWRPAQRGVVLTVLLTVLTFAFFHAMMQVDYDLRYRVPILPHLVFLAACGVAQLARRRSSLVCAREP